MKLNGVKQRATHTIPTFTEFKTLRIWTFVLCTQKKAGSEYPKFLLTRTKL